ncbi:MAG: type I-E CRISPR-associated endoribonuclease Cas2e [Ardenticatenaceae bacterium]
MVIMILESVPASLRGELSRWLVEARAGVFIGHVSAIVRDRLWDKCCANSRAGGVLQAWSTNSEQRFYMRAHGDTSRQLIEIEGLQLVQIPHDLEQKAGGSIIQRRLQQLKQTTTSS